MNSSYLMVGMPLGNFLRLLLKNGVTPRSKYLKRLLFVTNNAFWTSFFSLRETILYNSKIRKTSAPDDPIFIIGHFRTGSTFLHQLMNCDPELSAPTLFECSCPKSFISSRKIFEPVIKSVLPKTRPMDNVLVSLDEPQEDEYALFKMTGFSPLERLIFPKSSEYFILNDKTFLPPRSKLDKWEKALIDFVTKLKFNSNGKRIVLKNPFHALRIPVIKKLFPNASFIHIYRNPLDVIPSTARTWSIVGDQNTMRREWKTPKLNEVVNVFDRILTQIRNDLHSIPKKRYFEIKFEDIEKDPLSSLKSIYGHFDMNFTDTLKKNISGFLKNISGYKKNNYILKKEEKEIIVKRLSHHMKKDGYL